MTDMRQVAVVRHYGQFLDVIRQRIDEIGITHLTLDAAAGLQTGYSSRLLLEPNPEAHPMKRMGAFVMFQVMEALGLELVLRENPLVLEQIKPELVQRRRPRMLGRSSVLIFRPDELRLNGLKGAAARNKNLSPAQRTRIARKAARARWRNN